MHRQMSRLIPLENSSNRIGTLSIALFLVGMASTSRPGFLQSHVRYYLFRSGLCYGLMNESGRTEDLGFHQFDLGDEVGCVLSSGLTIAQNDSEVVVDWVESQ